MQRLEPSHLLLRTGSGSLLVERCTVYRYSPRSFWNYSSGCKSSQSDHSLVFAQCRFQLHAASWRSRLTTVCLFVCLSACLASCLCLCDCLFVWFSAFGSLYIPIAPCLCCSFFITIRVSVSLRPSLCRSLYLSLSLCPILCSSSFSFCLLLPSVSWGLSVSLCLTLWVPRFF